MKIALNIYNAKNKIELEDSDFNLILDAMQKDQSLNNMAKATALEFLNGHK